MPGDVVVRQGFLGRLEALRGIAALWVAIGHSMIWLSFGEERAIWTQSVGDVEGIQATIARAIISICSGTAAVNIFFVLSGFVLAKSLRGTPLGVNSYLRYGIKRAFRIFPAHWFTLLIILIYLGVMFPGYADNRIASIWFNLWYQLPVSVDSVSKSSALIAPILNPSAWTLQVEMLASLMLPMIVWCIGSKGLLRSVIAICVGVALALLTKESPGSVFHYLYMFIIGAVLSKHAVAEDVGKSATPLVIACLSIMVATCFFWPLAHTLLSDGLIVLGASGLIWAISTGKQSGLLDVLDNRAVRFLGRISYSFYLIHFVVLYAVATIFLDILSENILTRFPLLVVIAAGAVSIMIAIPLSMFSFRYVEMPLTQLGRSISLRRETNVQIEN